MSDESKTETTGTGKGDARDPSLLRLALEPAAKEMGRALETMAQVVNLALAPVSVTAWTYDAMRETMVKPMAGRMRKGLDSMGQLMEEMNTETVTDAAGKMVEMVSPALMRRKPASADLAYDPLLETRQLGCDACSTEVAAKGSEKAYQFDFSVSRTDTYVIQTRGKQDLVLGLFHSEPPYRRITYKDDGGDGRNPLIRRRLEPGTYFVVAKRFGGESIRSSFELSVEPEPKPKKAKK